MSEIEDHISEDEQEARMQRLSHRDRDNSSYSNYSSFVKFMRLVLPLAALAVLAVLFVGTGSEENIVVSKEDLIKTPKISKQEISQNELINPRFESTDKKDQPYQIVAERAIQSEDNKDLIMLENPVGVMKMKDGEEVRVTSKEGSYQQDIERFFLEGDVSFEHGEGYILQSQEAHIDLQKNYAWSKKPVRGMGPDISIVGSGMQANGETGEVIFTGPAKLILSKGFEGIE